MGGLVGLWMSLLVYRFLWVGFWTDSLWVFSVDWLVYGGGDGVDL